MLFFRSEEALRMWLDSRQAARGAIFTIPQLWKFSQRWNGDRMSPDFRGRSLEQVQEIFKAAGLTSEFWQTS